MRGSVGLIVATTLVLGGSSLLAGCGRPSPQSLSDVAEAGPPDAHRLEPPTPDGETAEEGAADAAPSLRGAGIATVGGTTITAGDKSISEMGFGTQVKTCAGDVCVTGGLSP